jgi:hypothetical protein
LTCITDVAYGYFTLPNWWGFSLKYNFFVFPSTATASVA